MAEQTLFDEALETPQSNDNFLDKYVGEGKKYKDVEELAKAYDNANNFIPKLQTDMESLREFTLAQLKERAEKNNEPLAPNPNDVVPPANNPPRGAPPKEADEEVDLDERIRKALDAQDKTKRFQNNAKLTEDVMSKHFGSREASVEAIRKKAEELEVSPQFLADMAFSSPKAFFRTMEITEESPTSRSTPTSSSDVNPRLVGTNTGAAKPGTYAYYDNMRRNDPKKYRSFEVQRQLMDDAQRLGNDFFKR